jgi:response regulator RpfG family c-di-GMP phosphodiesterase
LAEAVDRDEKIYNEVNFTREQMREIRYASLLHDFGKVGVREQVLVKARKLYPEQMQLVSQRFDFVRRTVESENSRARIDYLLEKGREEYLASQAKFDAELKQRLEQVDSYFQTILTSNEPTVLPEGNFQHLLNIAATNYIGWDGSRNPLLTDDEVRLLSIRKGSLDDQERLEIESHVVHTYNFLKQIPWTREIRNIPQIARGHHEKLNGLGYPFKLSAPEIPLQTRMMTVSDVFDALSAADRPYKKAVSREAALDILGDMVNDGEVDKEVYNVFVQAKIYDRSNVESLPY